MTASTPASTSGVRPRLFLVSLLILFLELACIRWFPAHVMFLTFFTNVVLLASFLGMSLGCLSARSSRRFISLTPALLVLALVAAHLVEFWTTTGGWSRLDVGNQSSPQVVFFGAEHTSDDPTRFLIPIEVVSAFFFLVITLVFVGPGQELGRALGRLPNRVEAYTVDIVGSLVGIVLFSLCSLLHLGPAWWFLPVSVALAYLVVAEGDRHRMWLRAAPLVLVPFLAGVRSGESEVVTPAGPGAREYAWSPYYRIDYVRPLRSIIVNQIGHQQMMGRDLPVFAYAVPHLLNRDAGRPRFENVLVIGAGSGNDVSHALQWGAKHVDAVEIDPVIQQLGARDHPDRPYDDPRVTVHNDDGRNFLRRTRKKYDLVVYALVDSLVLHSGYSNIRLESYLFTRQAFEDVRRCLAPDGVFAMYNLYRQGWIAQRLRLGVKEAFGAEPLVFSLPYRESIGADDPLGESYTMFLAGDTDPIAAAFGPDARYWLQRSAPSPETPNGFEQTPAEGARNWYRIGPSTLDVEELPVAATDDWPFLYLREPMIPDLTVRGILVMGGLAAVLLFVFMPRNQPRDATHEHPLALVRMFALGAGFMLVETKAVVHMAMLFGSTWIVNSVVFFGILLMILLANLFVLRVRPSNLWPYWVGLVVSLLANALVPLDVFLGASRTLQIAGACLLVSAPVLFAGVIFAVSFARTSAPDRAFGANIAGAMCGGLAENASMLVGFPKLVLVALGFYVIAMVRPPRSVAATGEPSKESTHEPSNSGSPSPSPAHEEVPGTSVG